MLRHVPSPVPDVDTESFWAGCQRDAFLLPRCADCGKFRWPPGPCCPFCRSASTAWIEASGKGRIYSWTVVCHPSDPMLADQVPYVIVLVDLNEGVRVLGNLVGADPPKLAAGLPVSVIFEGSGNARLPNFVIDPTDTGNGSA